VELGGESPELRGGLVPGQALLQELDRLLRVLLPREHLDQRPPGEDVLRVGADHGPQRLEGGIGLSLLGADLREGHLEAVAELDRLLVGPGERGARLLDRGARLVASVLREQRLDPHQPRLGPVGVEAFGLGERPEGVLEVAELELGLRAQHEGSRVLSGFGDDPEHRLARLARVAEQERHPSQGDLHLVALREAARRVLEEPAGAGRVAGLDEEARRLEERLGSLGEGVAQVLDGLEGGGPVAALDGLGDLGAGRLGSLLGRRAREDGAEKQGRERCRPHGSAVYTRPGALGALPSRELPSRCSNRTTSPHRELGLPSLPP
jgi:hypothetical protein